MNEKPKEPPKEVKQKYLELQLLQHQIKQVQNQIEALGAQSQEMDAVQQVLEDFSRAKPGSDSFVTLTPGLFVKAKIEKTDAVLLNVGGGAVVEKSVPDAKKIVSGQGLELRKLQQELAEQLEKLAGRYEKLQEEMRKLLT